MLPLSVYVHIPWCLKKCPYCDFNSHAVKGDTPENQYIDALLADLAIDINLYDISRPISSIFIGGGTPSLFSPEALDRLLRGIQAQLILNANLEITLEANPGTFESSKFSEFRAIGINRLSIGIQSFNADALKQLGRVHSAEEAIIAAEIAHGSGFENFNLDLMFGLPGQSTESSLSDVRTAISLNPKHISFYQLTLEPNTYFHKFPPSLPNDELVFNIQKAGQELLAAHEYRQYEVSAYGKEGCQCQHNLNYWQFGDYLGIGAGAHGKISQQVPSQIIRTAKPRQPEQYMLNSHLNAVSSTIAISDLPLEFLMNRLRLTKGFHRNHYEASTGLSISTLEPQLSACLNQGLLISCNGEYQCTTLGWDHLDTLLATFLK